MIATQFRQFSRINTLWLVILLLVVLIPKAINLPAFTELSLVEAPIAAFFWGKQGWEVPSWLNALLAGTAIFLQALHLNRISNQYKLFARPSSIVSAVYILLAAYFHADLAVTPALLSNFFLIWMFHKLLSFYHRDYILTDTFDLGIMVAVGSMIYLPFLGFILVAWAGLGLFRTFAWREWVAPLFGFFAPYFLLWVLFFISDQGSAFQELWQPLMSTAVSVPVLQTWHFLEISILIIIVLLTTITLPKTFFKRIAHVRKSFQLAFIVLIIGVLGFLWSENTLGRHFYLLVPSISLYMGYYFQRSEKPLIYESLFLTLLLLILLHGLV